MSELAAEMYQWRVEDYGLQLPEVLDGKPRDLVSLAATAAPEAVAEQFCDMARPVEDFAIGGIPATYGMLGYNFSPATWKSLVNVLPSWKQYFPVETYAERHIEPLAAQALSAGATEIWLEAFARDEIPPRAFKQATNRTILPHTRGEYEPSQVFLTVWAAGVSGCKLARLTLVQGIYDVLGHRDVKYISARYGGTALLPSEITTMGIGSDER